MCGMDKMKKTWDKLTPAEREELAAACGTTAHYLRNVAYGYRSAGPRLAALLERETGGAVTRKDFFPDDWQTIWPELQ